MSLSQKRPGLSVACALQEFDDFLQDVVTDQEHSPEQRLKLLEEWKKGPSARACHPREEHLLPLHVIAGAGPWSSRHVTFDDELMGVKVSSFQLTDGLLGLMPLYTIQYSRSSSVVSSVQLMQKIITGHNGHDCPTPRFNVSAIASIESGTLPGTVSS